MSNEQIEELKLHLNKQRATLWVLVYAAAFERSEIHSEANDHAKYAVDDFNVGFRMDDEIDEDLRKLINESKKLR